MRWFWSRAVPSISSTTFRRMIKWKFTPLNRGRAVAPRATRFPRWTSANLHLVRLGSRLATYGGRTPLRRYLADALCETRSTTTNSISARERQVALGLTWRWCVRTESQVHTHWRAASRSPRVSPPPPAPKGKKGKKAKREKTQWVDADVWSTWPAFACVIVLL